MKEYGPLVIAVLIVVAGLYTGYKDGDIFVPVNDIRGTTQKNTEKNSGVKHSSGQVKGISTIAQPNSPYKNKIGISAIKNPATVASAEYITISSSGIKDPILMTGWKVTSDATGNSVTIGNASPLPDVAPVAPLYLGPREKIILLTGKSPINISFRLNMCTGYFEDKKNFTPDLPLQCPAPEHEKSIPKKVEDSETCMDFLESFSSCEPLPKELPNLPASCKAYVQDTISYEGCVALHNNDTKFYKSEWRVFSESPFPLWHREKDTLRLWDREGRLVDVYEYDFD